jgi:glycerate kinase
MKKKTGVRVLVCPDKFKGTLDARAAADAIRKGWLDVRAEDSVELLPISDGGDGFGDLLGGHLRAHRIRTQTVDAALRGCQTDWWWEPRSRTAIVESARTIGLAMLPRGEFHPFELDTRGLAAVLRAVARRKPRRCIVGVGGSATNDGGFGLARGLGWCFRDEEGRPVETWPELIRARNVEPPVCPLGLGELIVAVDVQNPLLGSLGASRVYGPQKGLREEDFARAEAALKALARVMRRFHAKDYSRVRGAGAAGGLGFGLMAFCDAQLERGFTLFSRTVELEKRVRSVDLVITGEGSVDRSSFMGKGVGMLVVMCRAYGVQCLGIGGRVIDGMGSKFTASVGLTQFAPESETMRRSGHWLRYAAGELARQWVCGERRT